jgi:hypothetical protein
LVLWMTGEVHLLASVLWMSDDVYGAAWRTTFSSSNSLTGGPDHGS